MISGSTYDLHVHGFFRISSCVLDCGAVYSSGMLSIRQKTYWRILMEKHG
jgi:hypothetical protein